MRSWTDKDLKIAVQNSISFVQVFDKLGLSRRGSYKIIKFYIKKLNIDTSHFLTLEEINKKSRSFLKKRTKQDIFVKDGSYNDCKTAKAIIIREQLLEYKCSECKISAVKMTMSACATSRRSEGQRVYSVTSQCS